MLFDRVKVLTATLGTSNFTLGAAEEGYQTWAAAGATNGQLVRYIAVDGANWEVGEGVYNGTTIARTTIHGSSNAGSKIVLSGDTMLFSGLSVQDMDAKSDVGHVHTKAEISDFTEADYATAAQGASANTAFGWGDHSLGGYLTSVAWGDVTGKPTTFSPSAHTHSISNITGLQTALDGKATTAQGAKADSAVQPFEIANAGLWDTAYGWGNHASASYEAARTQVSGAEITAGTGTTIRSYAPADIKALIDTHAAGGGGGMTYSVINTTATATSGSGYICDTSVGAFTVTLPSSPSAGAIVVVSDANSNWGTANLTVARNGTTIEDAAEDLVCDVDDLLITLLYTGTTWQVHAEARSFDSATAVAWSDVTGKPTIPTVSDVAYDQDTWDGNTDAPSKNAVRDAIENMNAGTNNGAVFGLSLIL